VRAIRGLGCWEGAGLRTAVGARCAYRKLDARKRNLDQRPVLCDNTGYGREPHRLQPQSLGSSGPRAPLVKPLAVAALLDAAVADNAVAEALAAKGNPELPWEIGVLVA